MRVYCWRTGAALDIPAGEKCPECGCMDHRPVENCGSYAPCPKVGRWDYVTMQRLTDFGGLVSERSANKVWHEDHGHPCELPPDHEGPHKCGGCDE